MRPLVAVTFLTLLLFLVGTVNTWRMYQEFREMVASDLRLTELVGRIVHLDEVLTMSARMSAATGDPAWEERYRRFEPELGAAIEASIAIAPEAYATSAADATDAANAALVDLETQAFELVRVRDLEGARRVLFSSEYEQNKMVYAEGMAQVMHSLEERSVARTQAFSARALGTVVASIVLFAIIAGCWWHIVGLIRRYLKNRTSLQRRVDQRTKEVSESHAKLQDSLEELRGAQRQLIEASRRKGMADVATSVLHNVGNALNSINVTSTLVCEAVQSSQCAGVGRVAALLAEHADDLGAFVSTDGRGPKLVAYLAELSRAMEDERAYVLKELALMQKGVDHVKTIVSMQQSHARAGGPQEALAIGELLDDALELQFASKSWTGVEVVRDYAEMDQVEIDRHKVLQIILNLLSNARDAMAVVAGERRLTLRTRTHGRRFSIEVEDTGLGIEPSAVTKLFQHGFTTKKHGHGFGLHGSACAAVELGGTLGCHSEGVGTGATFRLELPVTPPAPSSVPVERAKDIKLSPESSVQHVGCS